MPVPDSVRLKLDWAREHVKAAKERADAFIDSNPYAVGRELEDDGAKHVYRFTRYAEPPPEIGLCVGDAVHNLRSSLDHLALALAHKGAEATGQVMTREEETVIQFPIVKAADEFEKQVRRDRLRYVDVGAVDEIRSLQPFNFRNNYVADELWNVSDLDNADKHRKLLTAGSAVHVTYGSLPPGVPRPRAGMESGGWGLGAPVVTYVFPTPQPEVDMELQIRFAVVLEEAWPPLDSVHVVLGKYIDYVENEVVRPLSDAFL